jgi:hypothetical protein
LARKRLASQHVDGVVDAGLRRLHRIVAVANGRCWTSKIIDLVDLDVEREGYVVPNDLEAMVIKQMIDIALRTGVQTSLSAVRGQSLDHLERR